MKIGYIVRLISIIFFAKLVLSTMVCAIEYLPYKEVINVSLGTKEGEIAFYLPAMGGIDACNDMAIDYEGNFWLSNFRGNKILKFSKTGKYIGSYNIYQNFDNSSISVYPRSLSFDIKGNVYVILYYSQKSFSFPSIIRLNKEIKLDKKLFIGQEVEKIFIDRKGNLYASIPKNKRKILNGIFNFDGKLLQKMNPNWKINYFDYSGYYRQPVNKEENSLWEINDIDGKVVRLIYPDDDYVGGYFDLEGNSYVGKLKDLVGNNLGNIIQPSSEVDYVLPPKNPYDDPIKGPRKIEYTVSSMDIYGNVYIEAFTKDKYKIFKWAKINYEPQKLDIQNLFLSDKSQLAVNNQGIIYVLDSSSQQVLKVQNNKVIPFVKGNFSNIAIDSLNNIYLADSKAGKIHKYSPAGNRLLSLGSKDEFNHIQRIETDVNNNLLVEDTQPSNTSNKYELYSRLKEALANKFAGDKVLPLYKGEFSIKLSKNTQLFTAKEYFIDREMQFVFAVDKKEVTRYSLKGEQLGIFNLKDIEAEIAKSQPLSEAGKVTERIRKYNPYGKYIGEVKSLEKEAFGFEIKKTMLERLERIPIKGGAQVNKINDVPAIKLVNAKDKTLRDFKYGWGDTIEAVSIIKVRNASQKEQTEIVEKLGKKRVYVLVKWQEKWGDKYTPKEEVVIFDENGSFVNRVNLWKGDGDQMPDAGYRVPDTGYRVPDAGYRMPDKKAMGNVVVGGDGRVYQADKKGIVKWIRE